MKKQKVQIMLTQTEKKIIENKANKNEMSQNTFVLNFLYQNGFFEKRKTVKSVCGKNYDLLKDYYAAHNSLPTNLSIFKNVKIGKWLHNQKAQHKKNTLSQERIDLLDEIDPTWKEYSYKQKRLDWDAAYQLLQEYVQEFGELPKQMTEYKKFKLGRWLTTRKQEFKRSKLLQERIDLLDEIDPSWKS